MSMIKDIRKTLGVTQEDMARACGVSINTYRNWEHGVTHPNTENQERLNAAIEKLNGERLTEGEENA